MTLEMKEEQRNNYLRDEYLLLQNQYQDYDQRSLTIKGWVSGGAAAALGLAFNTSTPGAILLPIFIAVIVGVTWYLEAYWKLFQYALADRIRIIEAYFRSDPGRLIQNPTPFQIYHSWYLSYTKDEPIYEYERSRRSKSLSRRMWLAARHRYVYMPYVPLLVLCALSEIAPVYTLIRNLSGSYLR